MTEHSSTISQIEGPVHSNPHSYVLFARFCGAAVCVGIGFGWILGIPPWPELVALVCITAVAEQRDRLFGDETSISGSIVIALAAVTAFASSGWLFGPLLCGAMAGFYWPHLRHREAAKIAVNAFSMGMAAVAAALTFRTLTDLGQASFGRTVLVAVPATLMFWVVNCAILAWAIRLLLRNSFTCEYLLLIRSETEILVFAVGGAACGYVMAHVSPVLGLLALMVLLVAVDVLVIRRPRMPIRVGRPRQPLKIAVPICLTALAPVAVAALAFVEPAPSVGPLLALVAAAVVIALAPRLSNVHRVVCTAVASLAAVGALYESSSVLGPALVALIAATALAIRARRGDRLRIFAAAALPGLAAGGAAVAVPVAPAEGLGSLLVVAGAATAGALLAHLLVSASAVVATGRAGIALALGDVAADAWLLVVGTIACAVGWHTAAGGVGVALVVTVTLWLLERRRPVDIRADDRFVGTDVVDVVTRALCDRPGAPSSTPS